MTAFYKFDNEQQFRDLAAPDVPVDIIGLIQSGEVDGEPVYIEGFHVNTLTAVEGWEDFRVEVSSPVKIYG